MMFCRQYVWNINMFVYIPMYFIVWVIPPKIEIVRNK